MTLDCIELVILDTCAQCVEILRGDIFDKNIWCPMFFKGGMMVGEKSLDFVSL